MPSWIAKKRSFLKDGLALFEEIAPRAAADPTSPPKLVQFLKARLEELPQYRAILRTPGKWMIVNRWLSECLVELVKATVSPALPPESNPGNFRRDGSHKPEGAWPTAQKP
jgi:hypothetical protein